jgi:hypothetical protein
LLKKGRVEGDVSQANQHLLSLGVTELVQRLVIVLALAEREMGVWKLVELGVQFWGTLSGLNLASWLESYAPYLYGTDLVPNASFIDDENCEHSSE